MSPREVSRRGFVRIGASALGGLSVAVTLPLAGRLGGLDASNEARVALTAYVLIDPAGTVTLFAPCPEIGQGVRTALPMIVAEELRVPWDSVRVRQAPVADPYGPMTVGGSDSVADYWRPLREAGATARELLREAAARRWALSRDDCRVTAGRVEHRASGRSASFASLAGEAARLDPPEEVSLTDPSDFRLVGRPTGTIDRSEVVTGAARYGFDVREPDMLRAVVARCPFPDGRLDSWSAEEALRVPGVQRVVVLDGHVPGGRLYGRVRPGVAVLAEDTWSAIRGREALQVEWSPGPAGVESTSRIRRRLERALGEGGTALRDEGDASRAIAEADRVVGASYELPPLAHLCMEPGNFFADVGTAGCRLRGPTQAPRQLRDAVAEALDLEPEAVEVRPTLAGGGFGRRLAYDYGVEAALVSRAVGGPVQVVWTREDDLRGDYFRPPSLHRLEAGLDAGGRLVAWRHRLATASLLEHLLEEVPPDGPPRALFDVQGAADVPYGIPNLSVSHAAADVAIQLGSWRSVAHSFNVFATEAFLDEVAEAAGRDPLHLRLELLAGEGAPEIALPLPGRRGRPRPDRPAMRRVLRAVSEAAGWGEPLRGPNRGRGIACCYYKGTYAAHVAEVSRSAERGLQVDRIVTAVDCGRVVNPSGVRAQIEGAAMDGVATVLHWGATIEGGRIQADNFDQLPTLRIDEAPEVETRVVASDRPPSGMGEPPYPAVAPAIAAALRAGGGPRLRRLPFGAG